MNSRAKGKRGELDAAKYLREVLGCPHARRSQQYCGTADSADIAEAIPGVHIEVKRTEALSLYTALDQAKRDCGDGLPVVMHRRNRQPWVVIVEVDRLRELCACVASIDGRPIYPTAHAGGREG